MKHQIVTVNRQNMRIFQVPECRSLPGDSLEMAMVAERGRPPVALAN
jgi:hypothetical protein